MHPHRFTQMMLVHLCTTGLGAFGAGESTSISWKLTGLPSNTTFDMCF